VGGAFSGENWVSEFVDTNVFVRFLSRDDAEKSHRSGQLLARAEQGATELMTSEAVVLEVVQILSSPRLYSMDRALIANVMQSLLENKGLRVDHKSTLIQALDLYSATNLDYTDCLAIAHAWRSGTDVVYSYDRGLDRVPGVRRLEP
jgi:predicted nucleic-acid-binding protein